MAEADQAAEARGPHEQQCSFCAKPLAELRQLIAGPGVSICDECVSLCVNILAERAPQQPLPVARVNQPGVRGWLRRILK